MTDTNTSTNTYKIQMQIQIQIQVQKKTNEFFFISAPRTWQIQIQNIYTIVYETVW